MSILDYTKDDILFAHWLKRIREHLAENKPVPNWLDRELEKHRPFRNPNCSVFILDEHPYLFPGMYH